MRNTLAALEKQLAEAVSDTLDYPFYRWVDYSLRVSGNY
jgi:hypothetical protein